MSSVDPYAMLCVPSQAHMRHAPCAICPHTDPHTIARVGSDTICNTPPTKAAPPSPSVGAGTHTHSTLVTLSSSLCVKGLTRGCYGWWTKTYKLAAPLLKWQCGTKHTYLRSWATMCHPNWVECDRPTTVSAICTDYNHPPGKGSNASLRALSV
jgi:hypothetical protein